MSADEIPADVLAAARTIMAKWHASPRSFSVEDAIARAIMAERSRPSAAIKKVRDGYADQARFADIDCAVHFREFVRRIDAIQGASA